MTGTPYFQKNRNQKASSKQDQRMKNFPAKIALKIISFILLGKPMATFTRNH
jgi:hypothetical protein